MRDRAVDVLVATSLAVFPLLPTGGTYLGYRWPWALEVFFLATATIGLLLVVPFRSNRVANAATAADDAVKLVRIGYATWLIPVCAATVIALLSRIPLDWDMWRVESEGLLARLGNPMDQVADPLYALRVGLIFLEGGLAFWLLSAALRRTSNVERRVRMAVDGCLVGIGLVSLIAIVQYLTRANLLDYWVRANAGLTRSHSTLDDPNSLASFLVLGIGLAGGVAWPASNSRADWLRSRGPLGILVLAGAALVATVSRAGLVALLIAPLIILISRRRSVRPVERRDRRFAIRGAIAVTAGALLVATAATFLAARQSSTLPQTPAEALQETFDWSRPLDSVLKGRLKIWKAAMDFGREEPMVGIGIGQFPRRYGAYPGADGPENTHNFFLQVFAETGVLGLIGLCVLLAAIAAACRLGARDRTPQQHSLGTWLTVGILAFVLTWITGHPLLNLSNQLWFASVLAVGLAALRIR